MKLSKILATIAAVAMMATFTIAASAEEGGEGATTVEVTTAEVTTAADGTTAAATTAAGASNDGSKEDSKLDTGATGVMILGGVAVLAVGAVIVTGKRK